MNDYLILLYYCYTRIDDPESFREQHHRYCVEKGLRGRVIVAHEGINGTLSGLRPACEEYMRYLKSDPGLADTEFKAEAFHRHAFDKINVRVKPEIVHSGLQHIDPNRATGTYLEPEEFRRMKDRPDVVLLDVRSRYEHGIGRFRNALTLDINHFREFPEKIAELEHLKDKVIVTYCTGGVKCEKASAYLLERGFTNVYQLHGGIIKYGLEAGGEDFEGSCYVFDNRVAIDVNKVNPQIIGQCYVCGGSCNRMVNCANPHCNRHIPLCGPCGEQLEGSCSESCRSNPDKRPYNGTGYYPRERRGYDPVQALHDGGTRDRQTNKP
jgi:UPF0176 protein